MTRSQFQEGPATDHYHDTLGVDLGAGDIQVATVIVTDAQIKALPTTPIVLIPDPGVGKIILVLFAFLHWSPSDYVPYTNIDPTAQIFSGVLMPVFSEVDEGAVSGMLATSGLGNAVMVAEQTLTVAPGRLTRPNFDWGDGDIDGPFQLTAQNGSAGPFTGGDPTNVLSITVFYATIATSAS
jgi:hypothetical protein